MFCELENAGGCRFRHRPATVVQRSAIAHRDCADRYLLI